MGGAPLWWQCAAVVPLTWIGASSGNFNSMGMGRGKTCYLHDFAGLSAHGLISGALLAIAFYDREWWWPIIAGLACAPAYEIGWRLYPRRGPDWLTGPTQPAEMLWGGVMGMSCYLAA